VGLAELTAQVSFDDGETWTAAPLVRTGNTGVVFVHHPAGSGFVSLRMTAADVQGNAVTQTVIRAYEIVATS
jgi:hypothetical protein